MVALSHGSAYEERYVCRPFRASRCNHSVVSGVQYLRWCSFVESLGTAGPSLRSRAGFARRYNWRFPLRSAIRRLPKKVELL